MYLEIFKLQSIQNQIIKFIVHQKRTIFFRFAVAFIIHAYAYSNIFNM